MKIPIVFLFYIRMKTVEEGPPIKKSGSDSKTASIPSRIRPFCAHNRSTNRE